MSESFSAVILAAGEGKRMHSSRAKMLHEVCFEPMINIVIDVAREAGAEGVCAVVGHMREQVMQAARGCEFALQQQQLGTGHAVMSASEFIGRAGGDILVLCSDAPLVRAETIRALYAFHLSERADVTVLTGEVENPAALGRIVRSADGSLLGITEFRDCSAEQKKIREINSGIYFFRAEYLLRVLGRLRADNAQKEYYLTDTVRHAAELGAKAAAYQAEDAAEVLGVNDRAELAAADRVLRRRINTAHMLSGVTMIDPENTYIGRRVQIGRDTVVYPGCILRGETVIGEGCTLTACQITDSRIGDGCTLNQCVVADSELAEGVTAGPYVQIRPGCRLAARVKIGDFVELKNSALGEGSKVNHLSYVGDTDMGAHVNIGCGVVTVNYNGKFKSRTVIADDAFIGCNTNLVAPVRVGAGAYTAAGSTITEDVPDASLGIARERQTNKPGWAAKWREHD